jgi:hypothetical protein
MGEIKIEVVNGSLSEEEIAEYKNFVIEKYKDPIDKIILLIDGDFVNIKTIFKPTKFERIRRITGYLVGTLDRFNDGKLAEVKDRVPHTT